MLVTVSLEQRKANRLCVQFSTLVISCIGSNIEIDFYRKAENNVKSALQSLHLII